VVESKGEMTGATMACPDVDEISYELINTENIDHVDWQVGGGEIVSSNNTSATVLWGPTNDQAYVLAIPYTEEGCPGKPIRTEVIINQRIEPESPIGESSICFDADQVFTYQVSEVVNGRTYQWHINGGQIISNGDEAEVEVQWQTPGITGEIWYQEFSELDAMCSGISEKLAVSIKEELISNYTIEDLNCFGDSSGSILLNVSGGQPPYTYEWSHDPNANQPLAENLTKGIYNVLVRDSEGCEVVHENLEIKEPEDLLVSINSIKGTSCFGKADGKGMITVSGGVPPYRLDYGNSINQGSSFTLNSLPGGDIVVKVTDANQCEASVAFEVPSPEPLIVNVEVVTRSCPGEANGELMAVPTGGNGPFTYTWDYEQTSGPILSGIPKGVYPVTVLDQNDCISLGSGELTEMVPEVRMPTGFNPKSGGVNSLFQPISNCNLNYKMTIYNRWGELIFSGTGAWDGKIDGQNAVDGSYTYLMEYTYKLEGVNNTIQKRGVVTLLN